jgi:hypothetical protein
MHKVVQQVYIAKANHVTLDRNQSPFTLSEATSPPPDVIIRNWTDLSGYFDASLYIDTAVGDGVRLATITAFATYIVDSGRYRPTITPALLDGGKDDSTYQYHTPILPKSWIAAEHRAPWYADGVMIALSILKLGRAPIPISPFLLLVLLTEIPVNSEEGGVGLDQLTGNFIAEFSPPLERVLRPWLVLEPGAPIATRSDTNSLSLMLQDIPQLIIRHMDPVLTVCTSPPHDSFN